MSREAGSGAVIEQAEAAFAGGHWESAREHYSRLLEEEPSPEALDKLGQALWFLGEEEEAIETRERSFGEYRRAGKPAEAANVAIYLAAEYRIAGNASLANGWLGRGTRLLDGVGDCLARGWLAVELAKRASDPAEAERHAREAVEVGRRIDDAGIEGCALSHLGLALVKQGSIEAGLAFLDESIAVATCAESEDPLAIGDACCTTLIACERLADPVRARDWGRAISEFVRRRNQMPLSPWCRAVYGGFLVTTGQWEEAERELAAALEEAARLSDSPNSTALINLASLRLRQGRPGEAAQLLAGLEDRPGALAPAVELHIERGDLELAGEKVERRLEGADRRDPQTAALMALRARVQLAKGEAGGAAQTAAAIAAAAEEVGRPDLAVLAALLAARAARLGDEEPDAAALEDAVERFAELCLPLEEGEARLELAHALAAGRPPLAVEQARAARAVFERLGAARHANEAAALLRDLGAPGRAAPRSAEDLTRRERQVLDLLGEGLSNAQIAGRLVISPRTAEHHVANVLAKLALRNRAEAAAFAAREGAGPGAGT